MNHNSANLAFGRREKIFGGTKRSRGGKKPIRKSEKKWRPFLFFLFFLETVGAAKMSRGAPNGNVRPLLTGWDTTTGMLGITKHTAFQKWLDIFAKDSSILVATNNLTSHDLTAMNFDENQ